MAQLMPLPLTVSCFIKIQIGFTFLVSARPVDSEKIQKAIKRLCVCVCASKMHIPPYSTLTQQTHTIVLLLFWNLSGTTRVSRYQKGKTRKGETNLDLLEQEIVSGSGIC